MISKKNGLSKLERLHSRKQLDEIFAHGKSIRQGPLKLIYLEYSDNTTAASSFVFTVSKRQFKRAHDRNYIKRLLKEVYRTNKHALTTHCQTQRKSIQGCFLFLGTQQPSFTALQKTMTRLIEQLIPQENEMDQPIN